MTFVENHLIRRLLPSALALAAALPAPAASAVKFCNRTGETLRMEVRVSKEDQLAYWKRPHRDRKTGKWRVFEDGCEKRPVYRFITLLPDEAAFTFRLPSGDGPDQLTQRFRVRTTDRAVTMHFYYHGERSTPGPGFPAEHGWISSLPRNAGEVSALLASRKAEGETKDGPIFPATVDGIFTLRALPPRPGAEGETKQEARPRPGTVPSSWIGGDPFHFLKQEPAETSGS